MTALGAHVQSITAHLNNLTNEQWCLSDTQMDENRIADMS